MCLVVDRRYHRNSNKFAPLIAPRNLMVRKAVIKGSSLGDSFASKYYSPYRSTRINFGVMQETKTTRSFSTVEAGFHCFTSVVVGPSKVSRERTRLRKDDIKFIYGVIPEGAKYYMGTNNEVVTEKVIYFKTKKDLLKHYKSDTLAEPYSPKQIY